MFLLTSNNNSDSYRVSFGESQEIGRDILERFEEFLLHGVAKNQTVYVYVFAYANIRFVRLPVKGGFSEYGAFLNTSAPVPDGVYSITIAPPEEFIF